MTARDVIACLGALRGLPLDVGRKRAGGLLADNGLGDYTDQPIKSLSKGMAQTIQLFGTIVHRPKLIVLDEPFSGLDAINQRSEERRVGQECVSTCRSRWSPDHSKKTIRKIKSDTSII